MPLHYYQHVQQEITAASTELHHRYGPLQAGAVHAHMQTWHPRTHVVHFVSVDSVPQKYVCMYALLHSHSHPDWSDCQACRCACGHMLTLALMQRHCTADPHQRLPRMSPCVWNSIQSECNCCTTRTQGSGRRLLDIMKPFGGLHGGLHLRKYSTVWNHLV